jgi:hypothetical protein
MQLRTWRVARFLGPLAARKGTDGTGGHRLCKLAACEFGNLGLPWYGLLALAIRFTASGRNDVLRQVVSARILSFSARSCAKQLEIGSPVPGL